MALAPSASTDSRGAESASVREPVVAATLGCVAQWGVAKTTIDDIAARSGVSRATLYRRFPGGKVEIFRTAVQADLEHHLRELVAAVADADSVEDLIVDAIWWSAQLDAKNEALQFVLAHEPEFVAGHLAFNRFDELLGLIGPMFAPLGRRFLDDTTTDRVIDLVSRIVVSYTFDPSPDVDLADRDVVTRLVRTHVLPVVAASRLQRRHASSPTKPPIEEPQP